MACGLVTWRECNETREADAENDDGQNAAGELAAHMKHAEPAKYRIREMGLAKSRRGSVVQKIYAVSHHQTKASAITRLMYLRRVAFRENRERPCVWIETREGTTWGFGKDEMD